MHEQLYLIEPNFLEGRETVDQKSFYNTGLTSLPDTSKPLNLTTFARSYVLQ